MISGGDSTTYLVIEGDRPLRYPAVYARYAGVDCFMWYVPPASFPPLFVFEGEKCLLLDLLSWSCLIFFTRHNVDIALSLFTTGAAGHGVP